MNAVHTSGTSDSFLTTQRCSKMFLLPKRILQPRPQMHNGRGEPWELRHSSDHLSPDCLEDCERFCTTQNFLLNKKKQKKTLWSESASELYRQSDRRLLANLLPPFADRRCHVISVAGPYGRILGFLDRSRFFFLSVSSSVVHTRLNVPRSRSTTSQEIW
jgi:hypothetical protein